MRTILFALAFVVFTATVWADEDLVCPIPVFATCPDTLTARCGDSIQYQLQLLDQRNGQPRADARYFLAKGYGRIDSLTGEYSLRARDNETRLVQAITIGTLFTTSPRPDTAYCTFIAIICPGGPPRIAGDCPRHVGSFRRGTHLQTRFFAESVCSDLSWSVIPPDDSNVTAIIDQRGLLDLSGIRIGDYTAQVILTDSCGADTCEVNFGIDDEYPYDVRIAKRRLVLQGGYEIVPVTIDSVSSQFGLGGFDLLIAFDDHAISLQSVTEGDIFERCGWEYFTYRYGSDGDCPSCPSGLIRAIGIAETNNGADHPTCGYPASLPATLFTLKFLVSNDRTIEGSYIPIRFFWRDCDDNRLMCDSGYCDYFMAGRIFDSLHATYPIDSLAGVFPGSNGLPHDSCDYIENERPSPHRLVNFYHGGLEIAGNSPIDDRGDLNLNDQAFEIADAILFQRYFIYGPDVFTINLPSQIHMSDVNKDDIPLTVEDFCYMYQVIIGNELPYDALPPLDTATFELSHGALSLTSPDTLGALAITVGGDARPTLFSQTIGVQYNFDGANTHIFISPDLEQGYPLSDSAYLLPGPILTGLSGHEILSIETAEYHGGKLFAQLAYLSDDKYVIEIEQGHPHYNSPDLRADVSLTELGPARGMGGFQFTITYPRVLGLDSIIAGDLHTNCGWEYFTYRNDTLSISDTCSFNKVRIVALADINNGATHPDTACPASLPVTLFSLHFHVADLCRFECRYHPIRFYWEDCADNVISDRSGYDLAIADTVYDFGNWDDPIPPEQATFPGFGGVPVGECQDAAPGHTAPNRAVIFRNGGFDFACSDTVDARGDLNLNGIPFETADEEIFASYLVQGPSAFSAMPDAQLAATDINADNDPGTLQDFALFRRYACGHRCEPIPQTVDTVRVVCMTDAPAIVYWADDTLGAVLVTLQGHVTIPEQDSSVTVASFFDGQRTHILIWPATGNCSSAGLLQGAWIALSHLTGFPTAQAVDYLGGPVYAIVDLVSDATNDSEPSLPSTFALRQNYPNPFNAGTVIEFDLPHSSEVKLEIINVLGSVVYRQQSSYSAGTQRIEWLGVTNEGRPVASGIYYYRLTAGSVTATSKMLLLK